MCIVSTKSMTQAFKVKNALSTSYINSEVIKLDSEMSKKGCSYGVEFDCINLQAVDRLLSKSNIKYNQILNI